MEGTYTHQVSRLTSKAWLILVLVILGGGFVLWIQLSLMTSLAALGFGAKGFASSMSSAVDHIKTGSFTDAKNDVASASGSAGAISFSASGPAISLLGQVPGIGTAVHNWQHLGRGAEGIAASTTELIIWSSSVRARPAPLSSKPGGFAKNETNHRYRRNTWNRQ